MRVTCQDALLVDPARDGVPFGDRFLLPRRWTAIATGEDLPCDIDMTMEVRSGRAEVSALTLRRRPDGPPIIASDLRRVPFAKLQRIAVDLASWVKIATEGGRVAYGLTHVSEVQPHVNALESDKRRRHDVDIARVAEVFRNGGATPLVAVIEHFSVPRSTANKWVSEARKRGLLEPPAPRGQR